MAGFQVDGVCYSSALSAVQAMAAREVGSIRQVGTAQYVVDSTAQTASSITYVLRNVSSTAVITTTETVAPLPCGLLDTTDGLLIAWGIATAWLITHGILFLRRGLHE
jgi:hypothetical protein